MFIKKCTRINLDLKCVRNCIVNFVIYAMPERLQIVRRLNIIIQFKIQIKFEYFITFDIVTYFATSRTAPIGNTFIRIYIIFQNYHNIFIIENKIYMVANRTHRAVVYIMYL